MPTHRRGIPFLWEARGPFTAEQAVRHHCGLGSRLLSINSVPAIACRLWVLQTWPFTKWLPAVHFRSSFMTSMIKARIYFTPLLRVLIFQQGGALQKHRA